MAGRLEQSRKAEYRTHGAAAYDMYGTAAPKRRPAELPEERRVHPAPVKRVRAKAQIAPFSVLGVGVTVFLAILVIFGYVRLYQADMAIAGLEQELAEQQTMHQRLRSTYESSIDLKTIEMRAAALGMSDADESEVVYLDLGGRDYAVITPVESTNPFAAVYRAIRDSVQGLVEYLS